jgi:hypothetical protein
MVNFHFVFNKQKSETESKIEWSQISFVKPCDFVANIPKKLAVFSPLLPLGPIIVAFRPIPFGLNIVSFHVEMEITLYFNLNEMPAIPEPLD